MLPKSKSEHLLSFFTIIWIALITILYALSLETNDTFQKMREKDSSFGFWNYLKVGQIIYFWQYFWLTLADEILSNDT